MRNSSHGWGSLLAHQVTPTGSHTPSNEGLPQSSGRYVHSGGQHVSMCVHVCKVVCPSVCEHTHNCVCVPRGSVCARARACVYAQLSILSPAEIQMLVWCLVLLSCLSAAWVLLQHRGEFYLSPLSIHKSKVLRHFQFNKFKLAGCCPPWAVTAGRIRCDCSHSGCVQIPAGRQEKQALFPAPPQGPLWLF